MMSRSRAVILVWLFFCLSGCRERSFDSEAWQNEYSSRKYMVKSAEDLLAPGMSRQQARNLLGHPPTILNNCDLYFIEAGFDDMVSYFQTEFDAQDNLVRTKIVMMKED